jgi:hypothetical protein
MPGEVAKQLNVSRTTVYKGTAAGLVQGRGLVRAGRPVPPGRTTARRLPDEPVAKILQARVREHVGARQLSTLLGMPPSAIGAVLRREQLPHFARVDRLTGQLVRGRRRRDIRYEHRLPGDPIHVDVKKLGKIPPGGGWRLDGRKEEHRGRGLGWDFVHVTVDDHSRIAYSEMLPDERAATCATFLHRACQWSHDQHGVTVRIVLTDNAKSYRIGHDWIAVCQALHIKRRFIKLAAYGPTAWPSASTGPCRTAGPTAPPGPATTTAPQP